MDRLEGKMVRSVVGQVVGGADFFDRESELQDLRELALREHVLMLAARRVGKTSLLHRLKAEVDARDDAGAVYASVQGSVQELDFLRAIFSAATTHPGAPKLSAGGGRLRRLMGRLKEVNLAGFGLKLDSTPPEHWQEPARELMQGLTSLPGHWFLLVDELPVFVARLLRDDPTGQRARLFLEWFRSVRQRGAGQEVTLHWILAGSIGLDVIAHRHGLSDTINDLRPFRLGAFSETNARAFLSSLAQGEGLPLSDSVVDAMLERAGWPIPYHLQVLFADLHAHARDVGRPPQPEDVARVFEQLLKQHTYFDSWHERLAQELDPTEAGHALAVLRVCAADPKGASRQVLDSHLRQTIGNDNERERSLRFVLDVLEHDGYLLDQGGRYAFRSNLLREFWKRRYA